MLNWLNFISYVFATAATPGPNTIMSMSNGSQVGFKKTVPFMLGIWLGFSIVALGCTFFCSVLTAVLPKIKLPMLIIGAAYMLWLAWKIFNNKPVTEAKSTKNGFLAGFALQFVNPKIYIYCIVSMEAYILPYYQGQWAILGGFALLLATFGFIFNLCWAGFGTVCKLLFSKYARITNTVLALLLVYCTVSLFFA